MNSEMNRIWNCKNPNQGEATKVLCVCSAGLLRSPTMANVLHREFGFNTRAVGSVRSHALVPLEEVHVHWADIIVVVDYDTSHYIRREFESIVKEKTILDFELPDRYQYMDEWLQSIIVERAYEEGLV